MKLNIHNSTQKEKYNRLIHSRKWTLTRLAKLNSQPLCERCLENGYYVSATEIHHKIPVESVSSFVEMRALTYNPNNLMSLCHKCHIEIHNELGSRSKEKQKARKEDELKRFKEKFLD